MKKVNTMLAAALEYGKLGWRVFPILAVSSAGGCECGRGTDCDKAGKHPAINGWPSEATCDPEQIRKWWGERPDRGVGIATGEDSGLTVLDVDGEEGVASLTKLSVGVGMPPTPTVQSRPGRFHYYFQFKEGVKSNSNKIGAKLDARSNGGYVVAPPSRHATGGQYQWLTAPGKVEVAEWPEFLLGGAKGGAAAKKAGRPEKEKFNPANPREEERLREALEFLDPDEEELWATVGWILGRAYKQSDEGFAIYSAWSARSRKSDVKRTRGHYYERSKEVRGSALKTTGTIFKLATEGGWAGAENAEERERRFLNVFENPFRESTMLDEMNVVAAASKRVFTMGQRIIHIVRYGSVKAGGSDTEELKRDPMSYVVLDHNADTLSVEMSELAGYWVMRADGPKRTGFPRKSVGTFLACRRWEGIKHLEAFVSHPALREDGTLIEQLGYDEPTGLYLTQRVPGLKVEYGMKQRRAREAMKELMAPFGEYPWESGVDRAVFAAALFTTGLRHLFETAPLFGFSAPEKGSGKSMLMEVCSLLWYGITLSKTQWAASHEEREKRWSSFLLAGDRMIGIDNVPERTAVDDPTLNMALTSRSTKYRILGRTESVELMNDATWMITGNQLKVSGDLVRRCIICYIDPKMKNPSRRRFEIEDLPAYVVEHRARLMGLALSIASSWITAGRPQPAIAREYGSFSGWFGMIRPMLMWLGEADLGEAIDAAEEDDSEGEQQQLAAEELRKAMPPDGGAMTTGEIIKAAEREAALRAAFAGCMEPGALLNFQTAAMLLRTLVNKVFISTNPGHEFRVVKRLDKHTKTSVWAIEYMK